MVDSPKASNSAIKYSVVNLTITSNDKVKAFVRYYNPWKKDN
jgi:hypothetical protein